MWPPATASTSPAAMAAAEQAHHEQDPAAEKGSRNELDLPGVSRRLRRTPMNQRKAIPANGNRLRAKTNRVSATGVSQPGSWPAGIRRGRQPKHAQTGDQQHREDHAGNGCRTRGGDEVPGIVSCGVHGISPETHSGHCGRPLPPASPVKHRSALLLPTPSCIRWMLATMPRRSAS